MSEARRSCNAEQKAGVVRRHLKDKVTVGELSAELGFQPCQIHQWLATALAQVERAVQGKSGPKGKSSPPRLDKVKDRQIKRLEEKLQVKKRGHVRTYGGEGQGKKSQWGPLKGSWVPHDTRDSIVDYLKDRSERTVIPAKRLLLWLELAWSSVG